eukprot:g7431.t1
MVRVFSAKRRTTGRGFYGTREGQPDRHAPQGLNEKEAAQAIKELGFRVRHQYLSLAAQVCAKSHRVDEPFLDQMAFVRVCSYHSRDLREVYKSNGGWTEGEVNHLQSVFNRYDIKHTGLIASKELVRMVEDLFPVLARDRKMRPELQRIMKEVLQETWSFQGLGFKDFLKLMRLFREFQDSFRWQHEAQAIEDTGFNSSEVAQFRDFFLAAHAHSNSRSAGPGVEICFDQFWKMIFDITPLGDSLTAQLKNIFHQFTQKNPNAVRSKQRVEDGLGCGLPRVLAHDEAPVGHQLRKDSGEDEVIKGLRSGSSPSVLCGLCLHIERLYALAMASDLAGILSGNRAALPVYRFAQGALRCRVAAVAVHTPDICTARKMLKMIFSC